MSLPYLSARTATASATAAAGRFVEQNYGEGYMMALEASGGYQGRAVFRVRCAIDGSEFRVMADRYENAWDVPDIDDLGEAIAAANIAENARREAAFARIDAENASR